MKIDRFAIAAALMKAMSEMNGDGAVHSVSGVIGTCGKYRLRLSMERTDETAALLRGNDLELTGYEGAIRV